MSHVVPRQSRGRGISYAFIDADPLNPVALRDAAEGEVMRMEGAIGLRFLQRGKLREAAGYTRSETPRGGVWPGPEALLR